MGLKLKKSTKEADFSVSETAPPDNPFDGDH
jgi:hypothetical protein